MSVTDEQITRWRGFYDRQHDDVCCLYGCSCLTFGLDKECDETCNCTAGQWHEILDALEAEHRLALNYRDELTSFFDAKSTAEFAIKMRDRAVAAEKRVEEMLGLYVEAVRAKEDLERVREMAHDKAERASNVLSTIRAFLNKEVYE